MDPKRISALEYGKPASPKDDNPDSWQREVLADYFRCHQASRRGNGYELGEGTRKTLKDTEKPDDAVDADCSGTVNSFAPKRMRMRRIRVDPEGLTFD
ncbi:MAG: hypothetical protein U0894_17820 [Pirellulales bacterium]